MRFQAKRGAVGWPRPQARQIEGWAKRYGIDCDRNVAQTGTIYLTLSADLGQTIVVRVADHADAYARATFTVDPAEDQREAVREWIESNGDDGPARQEASRKRALTREFRRLLPLIPLTRVSFRPGHEPKPLRWLYTEEGEPWYTVDENTTPTESIIAAMCQQIKTGYAE